MTVDPSESDTARIPCKVQNQDFLGWFDPNGQRISDTDPSKRLHVESDVDNTLVMKDIWDKDAGNYTCRGSITEDTFTLVVYCKCPRRWSVMTQKLVPVPL